MISFKNIKRVVLKINWRILISGLLFQFLLGVLLLRVEIGFRLFKFFGDQMNIFLDYANQGSSLVFGELYYQHFFAFSVFIYFYLFFILFIVINLTILKNLGHASCNILWGYCKCFILLWCHTISYLKSFICYKCYNEYESN